MKCNVIKLNEDDQFISKIKMAILKLRGFYEYDASLRDSFSKRLNTQIMVEKSNFLLL